MRLDRGAGGRAGQSGKGLIYSTLHAPNLVGEPGEIMTQTFLSDPGPIIVHPCQWLTGSLTNLWKIEWIDLNMQTMQTMQTMQNMQNMLNI